MQEILQKYFKFFYIYITNFYLFTFFLATAEYITEFGASTKGRFYAKEAIILCYPFSATGRARLDIGGIYGNCNIAKGCVLGLARAM